jgi:hypothetical protein
LSSSLLQPRFLRQANRQKSMLQLLVKEFLLSTESYKTIDILRNGINLFVDSLCFLLNVFVRTGKREAPTRKNCLHWTVFALEMCICAVWH